MKTSNDLLTPIPCPPAPFQKALVQLPSISVAKATMRHYDEDEEPKIGSKRVYLNYSRSRSIETRDGDSLAVSAAAVAGNLNSNGSNSSNGVAGGGGGNSGLDLARALNAARGLDGAGAGAGVGNPIQASRASFLSLPALPPAGTLLPCSAVLP